MTDRASDDPFFAELERAAKGLSLVTDRASSEALRRLFGELHEDGRRSAGARADAVDVEFSLHRSADAPARPG